MEITSKVKESRVIPIVLADGTPDTVTLQGRSRIELPPGAKLDPSQEKQIRAYVTVSGEAGSSADAGSQSQGFDKGHAFKAVTPTKK